MIIGWLMTVLLDQGLKWILDIESRNNVHVIRYDDPHYLSMLIHCISQGRTAVLVNVKDKLDSELGNRLILMSNAALNSTVLLDNVLSKSVFTVGDKTVVQVGSHQIDWSNRFRLYLITKEEDSATNIELTSKVRSVAFQCDVDKLFLLN